MKPLCPICYRDACPWLLSYGNWFSQWPTPSSPPPKPEDCPHHGMPISPLTRRRILADLDRNQPENHHGTEIAGLEEMIEALPDDAILERFSLQRRLSSLKKETR